MVFIILPVVVLAAGCSSGSHHAKPQTSKQFAQAYTATESAFQDRTTALQRQGKDALAKGESSLASGD